MGFYNLFIFPLICSRILTSQGIRYNGNYFQGGHGFQTPNNMNHFNRFGPNQRDDFNNNQDFFWGNAWNWNMPNRDGIGFKPSWGYMSEDKNNKNNDGWNNNNNNNNGWKWNKNNGWNNNNNNNNNGWNNNNNNNNNGWNNNNNNNNNGWNNNNNNNNGWNNNNNNNNNGWNNNNFSPNV